MAPGYSLPRRLTPSSFCFQVEAVIHPRFLEELLFPDPQMDFLALSQELEQEEGLILAQVPQGQEAPGTQGPPDCLIPRSGDVRLLGEPLQGGKMQVQRE